MRNRKVTDVGLSIFEKRQETWWAEICLKGGGSISLLREKDARGFILRFFKRACQKCGERSLYCLEVVHLEKGGSLERERWRPHYYGMIFRILEWQKKHRKPFRYTVLCSKCHDEMDNHERWHRLSVCEKEKIMEELERIENEVLEDDGFP